MQRRFLNIAIVLASAALVVILTRQNQALAGELARTTAKVLLPYEGLMLPTIRARTLDNETVAVGERPAGGRQLLLVFTTTCPDCRASIPGFKAIVDSLRTEVATGQVEVLGISLSPPQPTARYQATHSLPYRVALFSRKDPELYRARAVPLTLVLDSVGNVIYRRFGSITTSEAIDSVVRAARMHPGVPRLTQPNPN